MNLQKSIHRKTQQTAQKNANRPSKMAETQPDATEAKPSQPI